MYKSYNNKTAYQYIKRLAPCSITPTFRHIKPYIIGKTLDVGMGTGEYLEKFPEGSKGVDVSEENIHIAKKKGLNVYLSDINEILPFFDGSFRTVFCSHVIEHVDSPLNLLKEAYRVLSTEGNLILAIPIEKTLVGLLKEGYYKGHETHLYGISIECIDRLLEQAGFTNVKRYYNFPLINRISFIDSIIQFISRKCCQYICTMYWVVAEKAKYTCIY